MPGLDDTRATAASKVSDWITLILGSTGVSEGDDCEDWSIFGGSKPDLYEMTFEREIAL